MKKSIPCYFLTSLLTILLITSFTSCKLKQSKETLNNNKEISTDLTWQSNMELRYASEFSIDYYNDGYRLITIAQDGRYLIVPEQKDVPTDLSSDITVLQQPVRQIYLVASAAMDMFVSLDALDTVRFSGLKADSWYIDEAREAMQQGGILHAGSYGAPDYEQILAQGCGLAIENTMIYHTPEVKEQLEKLGIPVLVDYSSYEKHPLGRTEWVRLYGILTGKEAEAEAAFAAEAEAFESVEQQEKTESTVAFFYITANGEVNVRRSSDYLPKMIEMAGGSYVFDKIGDEEETASSNVTMQMLSLIHI